MSSPPEQLQPRIIGDEARKILFTEARSARRWRDSEVTDEQLREIWELSRWGPSSRNMQPLRVLYVREKQARERLLPHIEEFNRPKVESAPVTAVLATDIDFHLTIPTLTPDRPERMKLYEDAEERHEFAMFNGALQAGYFILAIRSVGLWAGPMLGFDKAGVDKEFFADSSWRSILVVNIGLPGEKAWPNRELRLDPQDVVHWM